MIVEQAGGVVMLGDQVVLRLTPGGEYLFPKGHLEPGETLEETAQREVAEETGLEATIKSRLGEVSFAYQGDDYHVTFFLMRAGRCLPEWEEHKGRDVVAVPREQVAALLSFESYRQIWRAAERALTLGPDAA